jgi:hypothetical protein
MQTELDYEVSDHGSIWTIRPISDAARDWIDENVGAEDWQWMGGALAIEPRYAGDILFAMQEEGFTSNVEVTPA